MPRLVPILPAEVPKASLAGLTSAEETKFMKLIKATSLKLLRHVIKNTKKSYNCITDSSDKQGKMSRLTDFI